MNATSSNAALVRWVICSTLAVGTVSALRLSAQTSPAAGEGRSTFRAYCGSCHGTSGTGDGPLASELRKSPADLTRIAARNGGTFPAEQVARIIDGRSPVVGHGGGDMPVWGDAFARSTADRTPVDQKIQQLVSYLESIQVKP